MVARALKSEAVSALAGAVRTLLEKEPRRFPAEAAAAAVHARGQTNAVFVVEQPEAFRFEEELLEQALILTEMA